MKNSDMMTIEAGEIVLISLFGSMGDLVFLARLAEELSQNGYPITLIFNQWYLDNNKELLNRSSVKKIGLDQSSGWGYSRVDWEERARLLIDLFEGKNAPRAIVADISARHLAVPAKKKGIPFIVASPMPYIKTKEFFLGSSHPCVGKMGWFNLFRWRWGGGVTQWRTGLVWILTPRYRRIFAPEPRYIADTELRRRYGNLFVSDLIKGSGWDSIADSVTHFVSADPAIIPKCSDWNDNVHVLGSLLCNTDGWPPSDGLIEFLSAGPPPIYVGFGSYMALRFRGKDGASYLIELAEAAKAKGVRLVFCSPFDNEHLEGIPENAFVTPLVSHDWLFHRCCAVMCHGGYGTVCAAMKAQKPLIIFPHQTDQFYIAERMASLGVATRRNNQYLKFTVQNFLDQLDQLAAQYASLKSNAEKIGDAIGQTDGPRNHLLKIRDIIGPADSSMTARF